MEWKRGIGSTSTGQENEGAFHALASFLIINYQLGRLVQLYHDRTDLSILFFEKIFRQGNVTILKGGEGLRDRGAGGYNGA